MIQSWAVLPHLPSEKLEQSQVDAKFGQELEIQDQDKIKSCSCPWPRLSKTIKNLHERFLTYDR